MVVDSARRDLRDLEDPMAVECEETNQELGGIIQSRSLDQVAKSTFDEKIEWFSRRMRRVRCENERRYLKVCVNRDRLLVDSAEQMLGISPEHVHLPMRISFAGETAVDAGGLLREWFELVAKELFDESIFLFKQTATGDVSYVVNPASVYCSSDYLLYFRSAGRIIGRALLDGQPLRAHFATPVLKKLLGLPVTFSDLQEVDQQLYNNLSWLKTCDCTEDLALDFTVSVQYDNMVELFELKPGGRNIAVTEENKLEYIELRWRWELFDGVAQQMHALATGIFDIIPRFFLSVFSPEELGRLLCGSHEIDVADWRGCTQFPETQSEVLTEWFWEVISDFSTAQRSRLLQFCTGSSRLPANGFRGLTSYNGQKCPFTIVFVPRGDHSYPVARTCFNRLDIPMYKTKKELEEALEFVTSLEVTGFTFI